MSFDIKMLVLDIDGTILNNKFQMSENVEHCLKRLNDMGIKVVLATGRMYNATKLLISQLQLKTPVICYQGALVINPIDDRVLYKQNISEKQARLIVNYLRMTKFHINLYQNDKLYVENDNHLVRNYVVERKIGYSVAESFDEMRLDDVNKILAIDEDIERVNVLVKKLNEGFSKDILAIKSMPKFCEITNKLATKGKAIEYLANYWDIKKSQIMAIGDQDNDIEMLKSAGVGVAMGNSTAKLKAVADFITKSVDEDGVVHAVQEYIG